MAKGEKQKQKQLLLMDIFMQMTDDDHKLTLAEITALLKNAGANADRKTLYDDFRVLEDYGLNIEKAKIGRKTYYWLASRNFEITDVKLLIDAVQSSKFISESRSKELIEKLESLVSVHEAKELSRQVVTAGRIKTMNSSSYYNVDTLYHAINNNNQVKFKYFAWNFD